MTGDERYRKLIERDKTNDKDLERKSLFYILAYANNGDLFNKVNHIYDFEENCIKLECIQESTVDLCSSSKALVRLGFNLFNGYSDDNSDVLSVFCCLDDVNHEVAINALKMRLNKKY